MLWNKHHGNMQLIGAFEVTTPPWRRTVEQLLAQEEAISQLEVHVQAGDIFLLKLWSLMLAALPQSTNKVAAAMLIVAAAFVFMSFRSIVMVILLGAYGRNISLRKNGSEKPARRFLAWMIYPVFRAELNVDAWQATGSLSVLTLSFQFVVYLAWL